MSFWNIDLFAKGKLVEVSSDEEGFTGAWFVARVLDHPSTSPTPPDKMKFLVEYESLLCQDGSKLLIETVDFKFLRPQPPPPSYDEQHKFQVNDLVDAFYNDGWWMGVVSEVSKKEEPLQYSVLFENPSHMVTFKPSELRLHLDWVGDKWVKPQKQQNKTNSKGREKRGKQKEAESSSQRRKRGKHVKSSLKGKESDGAEGGADKMIVEDSITIGVESAITGDPTEKVTEFSDTASKTKDIDMANMPCDDMIDVDELLSMCSPTNAVDSREAMVDSSPYENQNLQFLERSPVLKFVQSLEEFQLMPQKPHFRPLGDCEVVCREGLAIKHMMTFVNVMKETSKIQVNTSRSIIDSLLKCLPELESHGFDVKDLQSRLLELQSMKAGLEQLETKWKDVKCEIRTRTIEGTKIKAELDGAMKEIEVLEEKMKVAKEKKTRLLSLIEEIDSKIATLKLRDDLLDEDILKVQQNIASLTTSPWK
ncbi:hypothetical protein Dsin_000519 [Dipteronia sinensis]|uniref:Agenet domain-containing protein n=1 Tax=Dipteronia sinensis TaxID=43782 RepID=A0AAE0EHH7_9ROSI|nr:hypothetical protein Dsin_000519 [Dipteronia sinensis]